MRATENSFINPGQLDFVPRERQGQIFKTLIAFAIALIMIFVLGFSGGVIDRNTAAIASAAIIAALGLYVIWRKQQSLDLVMTTEYQNMLFAQAAALGSSFCLFVRRDGTITYANDGLKKLFPHLAYSDSQALSAIFEQGGVGRIDRERIMNAIFADQSERLVFPIKKTDGTSQDYILTVEPLARPGGYLVIRGREYRDQRVGVQLLPDVLRATSADKLDHLLSTTDVAHYVTDGFGRFEYVNPAMEQLLSYAAGELTGSKVFIGHLLYQLNGQPIPEDYSMVDFSGTAALKKKSGALADVLLQHTPIRDGQGKAIGATGSILPHSK